MALFTAPSVPAQPANSTAAKQAKLKDEVAKVCEQTYQLLLQRATALWSGVWSNPQLSPALAAQALGTDGVEAFTKFGIFASAVIALAPATNGDTTPYVLPTLGAGSVTASFANPIPAGYTYTPNSDKSVTIVEPAV